MTGVDAYFAQVFHPTNPRFDAQLTLLTGYPKPNLQLKSDFKDFCTKLIDEIEEEKGEVLFEVIPRAGESLLYRIDSPDIKVKLLSPIVAEQIWTWGEQAPI